MIEPIESHHLLPYLGFKRFRPSPPLRLFVRHYWVVASRVDLVRRNTEYLYPEGGMGIVFNFSKPWRFNGATSHSLCFLDGSHTASMCLTFSEYVDAMGIRFEPGGAFPFFPVPVVELNNSTSSLENIGVVGVQSLMDQLYHTNSVVERLVLIEQWLLSLLACSSYFRIDKTVQHAAKLLKSTAGGGHVEVLAEDLGVSRRKLERLFKQQIGMTPKTLAKLYRVEYARKLIKSTACISLTEIGAIAGYYDQSHFIREFKFVTNETPSEYRKRKFKKEAYREGTAG